MRRLPLSFALAGLLGGVVVLASTVVGSDAFTEVSITALTAHTPTTAGTAWVESHDSTGTFTANADDDDYVALAGNVGSGHAIYTITPNPALSGADYDVSIAVAAIMSPAQTDKDPIFLVGRYVDSNNYYMLGVDADTAKTYGLVRKVGGTATVLSTGAITLAVNDVLKLSMRGDTIRAYQNGVQLACAVDANLTAAGRGGIGWGNAAGAAWGDALADGQVAWRMDDFLMTDFTGDGGDDNCGAGGGGSTSGRLLLLGVGGA